MAKGRVRSRMELREQYEAAEARDREARKDGDEGEEDEDVGDLDAEAGDGEEEGAAKKKAPAKKKPAAKKKTESKPRKKTVKAVRKRVVWVVYDNSNKQVGRFDYNKKADAIARAEQLKTEKKQTYFVQPLKEEITE